MVRNLVVGTVVAGLFAAMAGSVSADNRVSASKKGSLLAYTKVELKWVCETAGPCELTQDTVIDISNDFAADVDVQFYFVNGDGPLDAVFVGDPPVLTEREHPGWNWVDCQITLTANQPMWMSLAYGNPCQPFTVLDPGDPPGRPDLELPGGRILRGFVYAWAVNAQGEQIRWNHLTGDAIILNFLLGTAAEYNAYAYQVVDRAGGPAQGDVVGDPGTLELDGIDYDISFDMLVFDFYRPGSLAFSGIIPVVVDTDITLQVVSADLRQDTDGPVTTKAEFAIWDENETRYSNTTHCVTCWDQTLLRNYTGENNFVFLQTDKGKCRVDGVGSTQCPLSVDAALLGLQIKQLIFGGTGYAASAITMVGQLEEAARIQYDIVRGPGEANTGGANIGGASLKNTGRTGR